MSEPWRGGKPRREGVKVGHIAGKVAGPILRGGG